MIKWKSFSTRGCSTIMGKQHETFPGEQPEMPGRKEMPEINQPNDPKAPEVPQEDPFRQPQEVPPGNNPEVAPANPGENSAGLLIQS